ncbi:MAG: hypothetical protein OEL53_08135 [Rhodospirillales bacterium]|nr:hypothetical protein [Rhodospirillales bacterium]
MPAGLVLLRYFGIADQEFGPIEGLILAIGAMLLAAGATFSFGRPKHWLGLSWGHVWKAGGALIALACLLTVAVALLSARMSLDPMRMLCLVTLPTLTGIFSVLMIFLSRTPRTNLAIVAILIVSAELFSALILGVQKIMPSQEDVAGQVAAVISPVLKNYVRNDPDLGYAAIPDNVQRAVKLRGDATVYDVTYTINDRGWRHTPQARDLNGTESFAAFFGDSYTFGEGVQDRATLPAQFEQAAFGFRSYNFGFHGYGPQQMLSALEHKDLPAIIREKRGIAVFTLIYGHDMRLTGEPVIHNSWGYNMPYYHLDGQGNVKQNGTFTTGRPLSAFFLPLLRWSSTIKLLRINLNSAETPDQYSLMAKVFGAACRRFESLFNSQGCYVLIFPQAKNSAEKALPYLRKEGVKVLNYVDLFRRSDSDDYYLAGDGHPTARAHKIVSERLAKDIASGGHGLGE